MKSGYVAVVGRANAGKSTLVNVLVGEKVAIVSPKPQTTRDRILGVLTTDSCQIAFVDTPGLYKAKNELSDRMVKTAEQSVRDVDLVLFVQDGHKPVTDEDIQLIKRFARLCENMYVIFTKMDIADLKSVPPEIAKICASGVDKDVITVSARKGTNIKKLQKLIEASLPEGERLFDVDIVSDRSERFMVGEIMREKILLKYDKEIPHGVAVIINKFEKRPDGVYEVNLDIVCEKPNHKAIILGKQGLALKETLSFARASMEKFLGAKVFLTAFVKVKEAWRDRPELLKQFGYGEDERK